MAKIPYARPQAAQPKRRLAEPRRFIQVVADPRQVGKTTLVQQVVNALAMSGVARRIRCYRLTLLPCSVTMYK
jgi:predicted AAA+ superfamily ATPase